MWGPHPSAWQADDPPVSRDRALANWSLYACASLIATDVAKCRAMLVEYDAQGIYEEVFSAAFSAVLEKPNSYQTWQQFAEQWILSKVSHGNTYVLKEPGAAGLTAMYVLDPTRVQVLIAANGSVFYRLMEDTLAKVPEGEGEEYTGVIVPASEIIHDRGPCLFNPLCGVSPLFASALAASQGLAIQGNSRKFFENLSRPGGILVAPGEITDELAATYKTRWEANYGGVNAGRTAVLGNGLSYQPINVNPVDAELVEQLNMSATMICSTFHVPPFKIGIQAIPAGQKVADLNQIYYSDCLQTYMEAMENLLTYGMGLGASSRNLGVQLDLDALLRMDQATLTDSLNKAVGGGWMSPDEARAKRNLKPVPNGAGAVPYMQQQNWALTTLIDRPMPGPTVAPPAAPPPEPPKVELHFPPQITNQHPDPAQAEQDFIELVEIVSRRLPECVPLN